LVSTKEGTAKTKFEKNIDVTHWSDQLPQLRHAVKAA
jgi:hypothetical protein